MDRIVVRGGAPLSGEIAVSGAKNACLALMPAALLTDEPLTLTNAPRLADIDTMRALLESLGCEVAALNAGRSLTIGATAISSRKAHYDIVRKMRASILVLGPLLAREGAAEVSLPGGCAIGARPVDLHLAALEAMGATLELRDGYVHAGAPGGLRGAEVTFPTVSVGATENALMAATLARGTTRLRNAACEPEVADLARCLRGMGARIEGAGTGTITVEGVERLRGHTHRVLPDRIELGTYMLAPAIAGGKARFPDVTSETVAALVRLLERAGVTVSEDDGGLTVSREAAAPGPMRVATEPYPGFPTDLQAQLMVLMTQAAGESVVEERIFENRFMHVPELHRLGADIAVSGGEARIRGPRALRGAPVMASDLRASAGLVLAGLAAEGETVVNRVYHLDRGYERMERKLAAIGARIERVSD